jgi:signal transduction histidine kinase
MVRRAARRLAMQVASAVAVIVVLLTGVAVLVVVHGQDTAARSLLSGAVASADDVRDPPAGMYLVIGTPAGVAETPRTPAGAVDTAALARVTAGGGIEVGERRSGGVEYELRTERTRIGTVQAVLDLTANHALRTQLVAALVASGVAGLAVASLLAAWVSRRVVRPLSDALHLQRRFVADASHELRTPLTLLSSRAQLLQRQLDRGVATAAYRPEVDGLVVDARDLAATLDDLLAAADPRPTADARPVDLAELAGRVTAASVGFAVEHEVTLRTVADEPVLVAGTTIALRRAVTALVHNAVRHAAGVAVVTVRRTRSEAVLEVTDDGPGIEPAVLPHLFSRFAAGAPVGAPARTAARRSGLGLALVSDIAYRHGAIVSAHSASGETTFRLTFPPYDG